MKLFSCIIFVFLAGCSDVVTDNYQTYDDAKNDRLFIRGWLPDILPVSTFNIHVETELDINRSKGSFTIPVNDISSFTSHLQKLSDGKYSHKHDENKWIFTINHKTGIITYKFSSSHSIQ